MQFLSNKRAFTFIETLIVVGLMTLVVFATVSMTIASLRSYDSATNRTFTDIDAVMAMQVMVTDVREAKSVTILDGGGRLRIVFPKVTEQGYYNRNESDSANYVDYYCSDATGQVGRNGTWLWRYQSGGYKVLKTNVVSVVFEADTARSVKITVVTENTSPSGTKRTELTQRVVYLRNY